MIQYLHSCFISEHPYLFFILVLVSITFLCHLVVTVFRIINRTIRHFNIRKQGRPPPHCDADGDFRENSKEDSE